MKKFKLLLGLSFLLAGCSLSLPTLSHPNSSSDSNSFNSESLGGNSSSSESSSSSVYVDPKIEAYGYEPHLTEQMPKISVTTEDGSNDFATKYNRNDKLNGLIDYVDCKITTSNCEDDYILEDVDCEIKVRGNYTLTYDKKPLRLKFNKKQKMFGLNDDAKCKSWVLLADYKDRSMMNNATTFFLGNTILESDGYYSSDFKYVDVELNGEYWGVYLLVEQQQLNEYRIDLPEPDDGYEGTDIGYLLEYDGYYTEEDLDKGGDYTFTMGYNDNAQVQKYNGQSYRPNMKGFTIKSDITHENQVTFISSFMDNAYKIIYEAVYNDAPYVFSEDFSTISIDTTLSPQEAIEKVVDVKSLADMYLLQEIACDADIAWSSFYMDVSFEEGAFKKLTFEAPWDFDSAYGIKNGFVNSGTGLYAANSTNPWLTILINETWFQDIIKEKWAELIEYGVLERTLQHNLDATALYESKFNDELTRWPGKTYNNELTSTINNMKTHNEAAEFAYNWVKTRFNFINTIWGDGEDLYNKFEEIEGYEFYRYEAENATLSGSVTAKEDTQYNSSGGGYLGNVNDRQSTMQFTINSSVEQEVQLHLGISKRNVNININDLFIFSVNGTTITPEDKYITLTDTKDVWHIWYRMYVTNINLISGENTLLITTSGKSGISTNFDYIDIYAEHELS